jgi:hemerythrin superfamily protein
VGLFSKKRNRDRDDMSEPVKLLVVDHQKVETLFAELSRSDSVAERQALASQVFAELQRHTEAEEQVLYPFIRKEVPDGDSLMDEAEQEHAEAKTVLARVATLDVSTREFEQELKQLEKLVSHHVDEEESEVFPKLERASDAVQLGRLRAELETARAALAPQPTLPAETPTRGRRSSTRSPSKSSGGGSRSRRPASRGRAGVWVQPHQTDDGRWQVRRENASRASRVFDTQTEAERFGRELAKRERVELVVAGRDGSIRKKQSYGNDPRSIKG